MFRNPIQYFFQKVWFKIFKNPLGIFIEAIIPIFIEAIIPKQNAIYFTVLWSKL